MSVGTSIADRYRLDEELARNWSGVVWRAHDVSRDATVALKQFDFAGVPLERRTRFLGQLETLSRTPPHPHVLSIVDYGEAPDSAYVVSEFLQDARPLETGTPLPWKDAVELGVAIARGLDHAHRHRVLHLSLTPNNVLCSDGPLKLSGFGVACLEDLALLLDGAVSPDANPARRFWYLAPEQAGLLRRPVGPAADLYSLGVILHELLLGLPPFPGDDPGAVLHDHLARKPAPIAAQREELPPELCALIEQLLTKEPEGRPGSAGEVLQALGRFAQVGGESVAPIRSLRVPPLVAREGPHAGVAAVLGRASADEGGVILIGGEAGLGKSRLIEALARLTREGGGLLASGKCPERTSVRPLAPFADAVADYQLQIRGLPREGRKTREACLTATCPHVLGNSAPGSADVAAEVTATPYLPGGHPRRNEHFERCVEFLRELGSLEDALVLSIDDLQWADEGTLELFGRLAAVASESNLVLVGAFRPGELSVAARQTLERVRGYGPLEINLEPLSAAEARDLVSACLGLEAGSSEAQTIASPIQERVGGNPLHLIEVLKALVDGGGLVGQADRWELDAAALDDAALQAGVTSVIRARAERLGEEAYLALSKAAVVGRSFSLDLLVDISGLRPSGALLALERANEAGLVGENGSRLTWSFSHDKVREALYDSLAGDELRRLHGAVAGAIRDEAGSDDEVATELAHHYARSDTPEKALTYELAAGERALAAFHLYEAAEQFRRALSRLDPARDPLLFAQTVARYSSANRYGGDYARLSRILEQAIRIAEDLSEGELLVELFGRAAMVAEISGSPHAASLIERFVAASAQVGDERGRAIGPAMLGYHHFDHGEPLKAITHLETALANTACLEPPEVPNLTAVLGYALARTGRFEEGRRKMEAAVRLAESIGSATVAWIWTAMGALYLEWGLWEEGLPHVERAASILEGTGDVFYLHLARSTRALGRVLAGDVEQGLADLEAAIDFGERHGVHSYLPVYRCFGGEAELRVGLRDVGLAHVREALDRSRTIGDRWVEARAQRVLAEALVEDPGQEAEAERLARASLSIGEETGQVPEVGRSLRALGSALERAGKSDAAREAWTRARDVFTSCGLEQDLQLLEAAELRQPPPPFAGIPAAAPTVDAATLPVAHDLLHRRGFRTVVQVSRMVGATLDPDQLLDRALGAAAEVFGAERGVLLAVEGPELSPRAVRGLNAEDFGRGDLSPAAAVADAVWRSGRPAAPGAVRGRSCLCVPVGDPCRAVLYLENRLVSDLFTAEDTLILEAIAAQLAVGLENARAYREIARLTERLERENVYLKEELATHAFPDIIGESPSLRRALGRVEKVAPLDTTVLLYGETGVGKELFARAVHRLSGRQQAPLVRVNCSALSPTLVMSELFGHEQGAFTGANARRIGRFELAAGGTLFLDEIGDVPQETQLALLRVLCEGEFERVGGTQTLRADVRVIAATNRDLAAAVKAGAFRSDLFYRLNGFTIEIPPLRERPGDVALLAKQLALRHARRLGKAILEVDPASVEALERRAWPGNVRELDHIIERAVILCEGPVLTLEAADRLSNRSLRRAETLEEHERRYILKVLETTDWTIKGPKGAAKALGLAPSTLTSRMKKLGISRPKPK